MNIGTSRDLGPSEVDPLYLLACVILWRNTADMNAGWEVIRALASPDPLIRQIVAGILSKQSLGFIPMLFTAYVG
jgi:hypothetical protein